MNTRKRYTLRAAAQMFYDWTEEIYDATADALDHGYWVEVVAHLIAHAVLIALPFDKIFKADA